MGVRVNGQQLLLAAAAGVIAPMMAMAVLPPPSVLHVSLGDYVDRIELTWNVRSGATGYEVWRSEAPSLSTATMVRERPVSWWTDTTILSNRVYYYWIKTLDATGAGPASHMEAGYAAAPVPGEPLFGLRHYVDAYSTNSTYPYLTWGTAATNLQPALDAAVNGHLVVVSNGLYSTGGHEFEVLKDVHVVSANGPDVTVLYRPLPSGRASRVLSVNSPNAVVEGFRMINGYALAWPSLDDGGGVLLNGGRLVNCQVYSNGAINGGGVYAASGLVENCDISFNFASGGNITHGRGGGCYLDRATGVSLRIRGNRAFGRTDRGGSGIGGGAWLAGSKLLASRVVSNSATSANGRGGGVYADGLSEMGECWLENNHVFAWYPDGSSGGGAHFDGRAVNCVFLRNYADSSVWADIYGSSTNEGAAVSGTGVLVNCTLVGNWQRGAGGGLHDFDGPVVNCIDLYNEPDLAAYYGLDTNFIDLAGYNFQLHPTSPFVDAGVAGLAPSNDYAGLPRPQDGNGDGTVAFDAGAFEAAGGYLFFGQVVPEAGYTDTVFRFEVAYQGRMPLLRQVIISGSTQDMTLASGSLTQGVFRHETHLPAGSYQYHFAFQDSDGLTHELPSRHHVDGPHVYLMGTGLIHGEVSPSFGSETTTFVYRAHYAVSAPPVASPPVVWIDGTSHVMSVTGGDSESVWYEYTTTLDDDSAHEYFFSTTDVLGQDHRFPPLGRLNGPAVHEMPWRPWDVEASDGAFIDHVAITWSPTRASEYYVIERSTLSPYFVPQTGIGVVSNTWFEDYDVVPGRTYRYYVAGANAVGTSSFSSPDDGSVADGTVGWIEATDGTLTGQVLVTWEPIPGATELRVSRNVLPTLFGATTFDLVGAGTTSYLDRAVGVETTYYYWVQALVPSGPVTGPDAGFAAAPVVPPAEPAVTGDFDGDGDADPVVIEPSSWTWNILRNDMTVERFQFGYGSVLPVPRDYDGDGQWDAAVYDDLTGTWFLRVVPFRVERFGARGMQPVPEDYDGDGLDDLAVFDARSGTWYIMQSRDGFRTEQFGYPGVEPFPEDYDGDGTADLAVFDSRTRTWYLWLSVRAAYSQITPHVGARPVSADYTGNGAANMASYDPLTATWTVHLWTHQSSHQFGFGGVKPVPADYDGDGVADRAVFDPRGATWYIDRSSSGFTSFKFGYPGVVPLAP